MAGLGETLGSAWPPLAIRPCLDDSNSTSYAIELHNAGIQDVRHMTSRHCEAKSMQQ